MSQHRVLLFGATGALGSAIGETFRTHGWRVFSIVRERVDLEDEILLPLDRSPDFSAARPAP